jgi:proton-translocating NADH-quinone oxidoreductase chain L
MGNPASTLPMLLAIAWLLPLASFAVIVLVGKYLGHHGRGAGFVSVGAIVTSCVLSFVAMIGGWLPNHPVSAGGHHEEHSAAEEHAAEEVAHSHATAEENPDITRPVPRSDKTATGESPVAAASREPNPPPTYYYGDWYSLGQFGKLKITIGYYIDALTVTMFCMVTFIASCVHIYATGYMHDELHDPYVDHEVTLADGKHLHRRGRFYRFFQYLSLFSFSMLGIVIAGNVAMVFVFWELVGISSYFLIGFYIERKSASTAANKAFIVNRVGDFGMLVGMMALWASLGTFAFGDMQDAAGKTAMNDAGAVAEPGLFSLLRPEANGYRLAPPAGMIAEEARMNASSPSEPVTTEGGKAGQWLLFIAGVGIFCGCVGKSAQFPLHTWLPDAMEGPTPVSALVHSATMVAAGVYLVGRFYPAFSPEVLLVIATVGCITLTLAATIAITAVDIKRVLAYSTISQLGYMMLSLGLGGWVAGLFHLITHACFKSLLFLCSGSVIHAVHTNDMTEMGGLRKKMPITAYTMLVGCLAIIGAGVPLTSFGLSGYYSKDSIIEQAWSYGGANHGGYWALLALPVLGAAITAFYMFRLWFMTFAGEPRNHHRYDHAHESPRVMTWPLLVLAALAIGVGWKVPGTEISVSSLLEQAQPVGTAPSQTGQMISGLTIPDEHNSHAPEIVRNAGLSAFTAAALGVFAAAVIYLWRALNPAEIRHTFNPIYRLLWNKWYFDELYGAVFVAPAMMLARQVAAFDRNVIDWLLHAAAWVCRGISTVFDVVFDRAVVDGSVNTFAHWTWDFGLLLRRLQTGSLRQYVLFIVMGTLLLFACVTSVRLFAYG